MWKEELRIVFIYIFLPYSNVLSKCPLIFISRQLADFSVQYGLRVQKKYNY